MPRVVETRFRGDAHQAETSAAVGHAFGRLRLRTIWWKRAYNAKKIERRRQEEAEKEAEEEAGAAVPPPHTSDSKRVTSDGRGQKNKTLRESCSNKSIPCPSPVLPEPECGATFTTVG